MKMSHISRSSTRSTSSHTFMMKMKMIVLLSFLFMCYTSYSPFSTVHAKEIVATNEWQKLEEGDSIPKGLHVRMDIETGEKWVKLLDEDESDTSTKTTQKESKSFVSTSHSLMVQDEKKEKTNSQKLHDSTVKITQLANAELSSDASQKITSQLLAQSQREQNMKESIAALNDFAADESINESDLDMMYRTLSSLPEEELVNMDMQLPTRLSEDSSDKEKMMFEIQVRAIWSARQQLLKKMEEEYLADVTDIIQERIESIKNYLGDPMTHIRQVMNAELKDKDDSTSLSTIVGILEDLEFQLTDLDNARDFHDMGGWPLLVALLTDSIHGLEYEIEQAVSVQAKSLDIDQMNKTDGSMTIELADDVLDNLREYQRVMWKIQGIACWCMGTAVKNVEEFHSWSVEDFSSLMAQNASGDVVNVITILLNKLHSESTVGPSILDISMDDIDLQVRRKYEVYALGSLLRGNREAIDYFGSVNGPSILFDMFDYLTKDKDITRSDRATLKLLEKIVILSDDLLMEVKLHPSEDTKRDHAFIEAFVTRGWCDVPFKMYREGSTSIQRRMLEVLIHRAPFCNYQVDMSKVETILNDVSDDEDVNNLRTAFEEMVSSAVDEL